MVSALVQLLKASMWTLFLYIFIFSTVHRNYNLHPPVVVAKSAPKTSATRQWKVNMRNITWSVIIWWNLHYLHPGGCLMMGDFFPPVKDKKVKPDVCSTCTCYNETSVCFKKTCPVLDCSPHHQETLPGECCPTCRTLSSELLTSTCTFKGLTYKVSRSWTWVEILWFKIFDIFFSFCWTKLEQRSVEFGTVQELWMQSWRDSLCSEGMSKDDEM